VRPLTGSSLPDVPPPQPRFPGSPAPASARAAPADRRVQGCL